MGQEKMKKIRHSIFETNSSSAHSITIKDSNVLDNILPDEKGNITLTGGVYGWGLERFNTAIDKLNYIVQQCYCDNKYFLDKTLEIVKEHTLCEDIILDREAIENGYVDHQSVGVLPNEDDIKTFIFDKNSWLFISNDNSGTNNITLYDTPDITLNGESDYKYEYVFSDLDGTVIYDVLNIKTHNKISPDDILNYLYNLNLKMYIEDTLNKEYDYKKGLYIYKTYKKNNIYINTPYNFNEKYFEINYFLSENINNEIKLFRNVIDLNDLKGETLYDYRNRIKIIYNKPENHKVIKYEIIEL